jgi:adenosylcobinamide-phosphate synthase
VSYFPLIPLFLGWIADRLFGDPSSLPHPIVGFGKIISWGEKILNKGSAKQLKGALFSVMLLLSSFFGLFFLLKGLTCLHSGLTLAFSSLIVFYCLAGKTLADEVRQVFIALESSTEEGRKQVARIVGRDTASLSPLQIRTAALETLSENLSDGVVAPLFWYMLLGAPGMLAYKMGNTLDSMIGYKNEQYRQFGCWAARIDDVLNYVPARLTAVLMLFVSKRLDLFPFLKTYGKQHASPNSGYPEAALAGILNCRFGGPNSYFGKIVDKPHIGNNPREINAKDGITAIAINRKVEIAMLLLVALFIFVINFLLQ